MFEVRILKVLFTFVFIGTFAKLSAPLFCSFGCALPGCNLRINDKISTVSAYTLKTKVYVDETNIPFHAIFVILFYEHGNTYFANERETQCLHRLVNN